MAKKRIILKMYQFNLYLTNLIHYIMCHKNLKDLFDMNEAKYGRKFKLCPLNGHLITPYHSHFV